MKKFIHKEKKGKDSKYMIKTAGDLINAVSSCKTKEEANNLLESYLKQNKYARENIGYVIGYLDEENRKRLYALFDLVHPIFNTAI